MGGHTLLDESVVFFGSELSDPPIARQEQHAVHARGRRRQDHANGPLDQVRRLPHNKLLTSILNLFGDTRTSFGDSRIDSAPLKSPQPDVIVLILAPFWPHSGPILCPQSVPGN